MNRLSASIILLALLPISQIHADDFWVKGALNSFIEALKRGDADVAISLVYQPPGAEQWTQARVRRLAQKTKSIRKTATYINASVQGTIAIAMVKDAVKRPDGSADFDAMLLLKRDDKWLIVTGIPEVEDRPDILTNEERKLLTQLHQWEDVQMRELNSNSTPTTPK
jgi:hypothetical protein